MLEAVATTVLVTPTSETFVCAYRQEYTSMSLYSLAAGLFEDIDKARVSDLASSAPMNCPAPVLAGREGHQRLSWRRGTGQDGKEAEDEMLQNGCRRRVDLSRWTPAEGDEDARTPTIELLECCLNDVHRARSGSKRTSVDEPKCRWEIGKSEPRRCRMSGNVGDDNQLGVADEESWHADVQSEAQGVKGTNEYGIGLQPRRLPRETVTKKMEKMTSPEKWRGLREKGFPNLDWGRRPSRLPVEEDVNGLSSAVELGMGRQDNSSDADLAAAQALAEFKREADDWRLSKGATIPRQDHVEFASHLSGRYLCDTLARLPSSAEVSRSRREVAHRIDVLATEGAEGGYGNRLGNNQVNENVPGSVDSLEDSSNKKGCRTRISIDDKAGSVGRSDIEVPNHCPVRGVEWAEAKSKAGECRGIQPKTKQGRVSYLREEGVMRKKGVRFLLLGSGDNENTPASEVCAAQTSSRAEKTETEYAEATKHTSELAVCPNEHPLEAMPWTCAGCDKRNAEIRDSCIVCGRRSLHSSRSMDDKVVAYRSVRRVLENLVSERREAEGRHESCAGAEQKDCVEQGRSNVDVAEAFAGGKQLTPSGGHHMTTASTAADQRSSRESGGRGSRVGANRVAMGGGYDFSAFARMRRSTEPVVKARLGLTSEIKSLLSTIRGR